MHKKQFDVYQNKCPSHQLLDLIGDKWVVLIIHKLSSRSHRFGELQRAIGGISKKVLANQLDRLEAAGLVVRNEYDEKVLRVEYSLTELGVSLNAVCAKLTEWAESNIEEIERHRGLRGELHPASTA